MPFINAISRGEPDAKEPERRSPPTQRLS
jgi:hypothetical protein